jgi:hypothetical protein
MGSSEQAELVGPGLVAGGVERSLSVTGNFGAGSGSGALMKGSRFAADSMLEQRGFEPSVPPRGRRRDVRYSALASAYL